MTEKEIKISIIIRTYNSVKMVGEAINSVLVQDIIDFPYEILIVDDGSVDGTIDFLEKNYKDKVRIVRQKHSGHVVATNKGISESRGKYVTLLDSDDVLKPGALVEMVRSFDNDEMIDFIYCDYFEETGQDKKIVSLGKNIFLSIGCGIVFKRSLFKELGLFDKNLIFAEYDFLIKLINSKKKGKHVSIPLYVYRRSAGSMTSNQKVVDEGIMQLKDKYGEMAERIRKY